jgi:hypothetical protein
VKSTEPSNQIRQSSWRAWRQITHATNCGVSAADSLHELVRDECVAFGFIGLKDSLVLRIHGLQDCCVSCAERMAFLATGRIRSIQAQKSA